YVTLAYSATGVALWTNRYNGTGNYFDEPSSIAVDASGNVFVTGRSDGTADTGTDYLTIKYSNSGTALWTNRYDGPLHGEDKAIASAVDKNGNVFVTGTSSDVGFFGSAYATVAYSGGGSPLWTNRFKEPGLFTDGASGVAVDGNGNVVVTGRSM